MSNQGKSRGSERDQMIEGGSEASNTGRILTGISILGAVGILAYFSFVPSAPDLSGPDTSQTEDIQRREALPGVDTGFPAVQTSNDPEPELTPATMAPAPQQSVPGVDAREADRQRIAELERKLKELQNSQGTDPDLQEKIDAMQAKFDQEHREADQRYQALLAQLAHNAGGGEPDMSEEEREARRRLEEERQRRAAIEEAQIMSDGIVLDASGARSGSGTQAGSAEGGASGRNLSSNEQFIAQASTQSYETVRATRIANPGRTIVQGTTLNAVLETAISTELPGVIRAVVTDDVLSYDGMNVLIPQGSRLFGSYNSDVSVVQDRVQIAWNRAVTPEGVSVELGGYGADRLGMSGQAGIVDSRFRQRFGSAALISLMGAGPNVIIKDDTPGDTADTIQDVGDDMASATQGVMADYLNAGPVIYIHQGTYMTVFVNQDLVF